MTSRMAQEPKILSVCPRCSKPFKPSTSGQILCHAPCRASASIEGQQFIAYTNNYGLTQEAFTEVLTQRLEIIGMSDEPKPILPFTSITKEHDAILKLLCFTKDFFQTYYDELLAYTQNIVYNKTYTPPTAKPLPQTSREFNKSLKLRKAVKPPRFKQTGAYTWQKT